MEIIFYQGLIFTTLVLVRVFAKKYLEVACFVWTALTLINLFWPPLIVLQLIVVWGTYGVIRPKPATISSAENARPTVSQFQPKAKQAQQRTKDSAGSPAFVLGRDANTEPQSQVKIGSPIAPDAGQAASTRRTVNATISPSDKKPTEKTHEQRLLAAKCKSTGVERDLMIDGIVRARGIEHLVHFTQAENLPSIFREGLVSVEDARAHEINIRTNDADRYDGYLNAISLSVSFPNAYMFYKLRKLHPEKDWAILLIDPAVLYEKRCGFCQFNAADKRIPKQSEDALIGAELLTGMFDRSIRSKDSEFLRPCDPTDPQAEVLIFEPIELARIRKVVFFDEEVLRCYEDVVHRVQKSVDRTFLDSRSFFLNSLISNHKGPKSRLSEIISEEEIPF